MTRCFKLLPSITKIHRKTNKLQTQLHFKDNSQWSGVVMNLEIVFEQL